MTLERLPVKKPEQTPPAPTPALTFAQKQDTAYSNSFLVKEGFGLEEPDYKWVQNQYECLVAIKLPEGIPRSTLKIDIQPRALQITVSGVQRLQGELFAAIKAEESTWEYDSNSGFLFYFNLMLLNGCKAVLTVTLLKRWRGGNYEAGKTNAETWWRSLFSSSRPIAMQWPPTEYYSSLTAVGTKELPR